MNPDGLDSNSRRKILFLCGAPFVSGKEIITLSQTVGLKQTGFDVGLVVSKWSDGAFVERLTRLGIKHWTLPTGFISKTASFSAIRMTLIQIVYIPTLYIKYIRVQFRFSPDMVFHTNFHHICLLFPFLSKSRDWMVVHEVFAPSKFYRYVFQLIARRCGGFVAVSNYVGASLERLGISRSQIVVIPNGVELAAASDLPARAEGGTLTLGIVGQIAAWKGHEDALHALRLLHDQAIPAQLYVFGSDTSAFANSLKALATELDLTSHIKWCGFVGNHAEIYTAIDVLLIPSRFDEPFGLVAAEAASWGVPVVVTDSGELPRLIVNGITGFVVPKNDGHAIAEALVRLRDHGLRIRMGREARQKATTDFGTERMVKGLISLVSGSIAANKHIIF